MSIKRVVYALGYRPRVRTLLYSPSLALVYAFRDIRREHGHDASDFVAASACRACAERERALSSHLGVEVSLHPEPKP